MTTTSPQKNRSAKHGTKHGFHPALAVMLAFLGTAVISVVFGMLIFPVFAQVCAPDLLAAVAKVGYAGVVVLGIALLLEAYNLYEHHTKHVSWLVVVGLAALVVTAILIAMAPGAVACV